MGRHPAITCIKTFLSLGILQGCVQETPIQQVMQHDEQGRLLEQYHLKDSLLHGERVLFYPASGDTAVVETHREGKFHGPFRSFYPGNCLRLMGQYRENQMRGLWYRYDSLGNLTEEVTFGANQENGPFREYYVSGKLKVRGTYKGGPTEEGPLTLYDETGKVVRRMYCSGGICRTILPSDALRK